MEEVPVYFFKACISLMSTESKSSPQIQTLSLNLMALIGTKQVVELSYHLKESLYQKYKHGCIR